MEIEQNKLHNPLNLPYINFLELNRILENQTTQLTNFTTVKIIPLFTIAGVVTNKSDTIARETGSRRSTSFLILIAALILGSMAGVFVAAGKAFYGRFKIEYRNKVFNRV